MTGELLEGEIVLPVVGHEGKYWVSNLGRVFGVKGIRKVQTLPKGYLVVYFTVSGKSKINLVHRLVAKAFVPGETEEKCTVNHIDGNKENNAANNLEWCSQKENNRHAVRVGLADAKGSKHWSCKLTEDEVRQIRMELDKGRTLQSIADQFGTRYQNIWSIKKRISWSWLD